MKKFLTILTLLTTIWLAAGEKYSFMALGDIHFDGQEYHLAPVKPRYQNARQRNINMWKNGSSQAVLQAAAKSVTPEMPFVLQLGDFVQGDSDTHALLEKMFADGFKQVKSFFPNHKLLPCVGNHDGHVSKHPDFQHAPVKKAFLPLIARELGRPISDGNYIVEQGQDLYIFVNPFAGKAQAVKFVKEALKNHPASRYTFFITHLPIFPGATSHATTLMPGRNELLKDLARRNTIILSAHTHLPAFVRVETPDGTLTQITVSSLGYAWKPQAKNSVVRPDFAAYTASIVPAQRNTPAVVEMLNGIKKFKIHEYEIYSAWSCFAIIDVDDHAVTVKYYSDKTGKPWRVKTIKSIK